ncbi:nuclear transport factor 2 family protein [Streptomyces olivaceoviridis]|uniref:nuclear transport factor 2 family protein n=1 Tax=Streptomyces olivaceoviridis TaxID=1921 RepID=UPI0036FA083C
MWAGSSPTVPSSEVMAPGSRAARPSRTCFGSARSSTATARSYLTIFQAVPELPLQPIAAGRYRDRFERRNGKWRFAERRITVHMIGNVGHHLH